MKIALCFYGQPRFIDNILGFESHKKHILDRAHVDVFAHFWFDENQSTFAASDWSLKHNSYIHPESLKIISNLYAPKITVVEPPRNTFDYSDLEPLATHLNYYSPNNYKNLQSHLYSFEKVLSLVENTEEKYDFIIMSRFDNRVVAMPDFDTLPKDKVFINNTCGGGNFADVIVMFDYELGKYFKPYTNFKTILQKVPLFTAEEFKKHSFLLTQTIDKFSYVNILARVLRGKTDTSGE